MGTNWKNVKESMQTWIRKVPLWFAAFWNWFCAPHKWLAIGKMVITKCTTTIKDMHKGLRDRLLLGITAVVIAYVLSPLLDRVGISVSSYAHAQSLLWRMAFIAVILAASGTALWKITAFRWSDLKSRSLITRTPTWILALLAVAIVMWAQTSIDGSVKLIYTVVCVLIVPCIVWLVCRSASTQANMVPDSPSEASQPCAQPWPADPCNPTLIGWLGDEAPIKKPGQDRFGHSVYAQSIARRLSATPMPTVGLIGPYGCGKSSIVYLVEYYLNHPTEAGIILPKERFVFCRVPAWGASKDSIAMFILQQAIAEVSEYIDCVGLRGIPAEYQAALASVQNNWTGPVAALLGAQAPPNELLERLDKALIAIGYRLVICLEDMDRNANNEEYRQHVHALLDRVKACKNTTFILSTSSDADRPAELARFAEHIELVRPIDSVHVGNTVRRMHDWCTIQNNACVPPRHRHNTEPWRRFGLIGDSLQNPSRTTLADSGIAPEIGIVLNQPRLLKLAMRRVHSAWKQLRGEISLEDFIVVTVIRTVAPAIIDDLIAHRQNPEEKNKEWVTQRIQETATKDSLDPEVILRLVTFLFPHLAANPKKATPIPLQGVADDTMQRYDIDYWHRAISEYIPPVQPSDQEVLRAIRGFLASRILPDNPMIYVLAEKVLHDDAWSASVNHFSTEFRVAEYLELTGQVFNLFLKENEQDAIATGLPWFNAFVRTMSTPSSEFRPPQEQKDRRRVTIGVYSTEVNTWLQKQIVLALPISLDFATDLFSGLHRKQMPIEFIKLIPKYYPTPDTLAEMLLHSDEKVLLQISEASREHKPGSWADEMRDLLEYILRADVHYQDVLILQLYHLACSYARREQFAPVLRYLKPVLGWTPSLNQHDEERFEQLKQWIR